MLTETEQSGAIGHGRSDARAVFSALRVAREAAQSGMLEAIRAAAPERAVVTGPGADGVVEDEVP